MYIDFTIFTEHVLYTKNQRHSSEEAEKGIAYILVGKDGQSPTHINKMCIMGDADGEQVEEDSWRTGLHVP